MPISAIVKEVQKGEQLLAESVPKAVQVIIDALSNPDTTIALGAAKELLQRVLGRPAVQSVAPAERRDPVSPETAADLVRQLASTLPTEYVEKIQVLWQEGLTASGAVAPPGQLRSAETRDGSLE